MWLKLPKEYDPPVITTWDAVLGARVVDKYNAKVFRVRFEKQEDVVRLQEPRDG